MVYFYIFSKNKRVEYKCIFPLLFLSSQPHHFPYLSLPCSPPHCSLSLQPPKSLSFPLSLSAHSCTARPFCSGEPSVRRRHYSSKPEPLRAAQLRLFSCKRRPSSASVAHSCCAAPTTSPTVLWGTLASPPRASLRASATPLHANPSRASLRSAPTLRTLSAHSRVGSAVKLPHRCASERSACKNPTFRTVTLLKL